MVILGEKGLSGVVKRFLEVIFIGGIIILLTLPISLKWYLTLDSFYVSIFSFYKLSSTFLYVFMLILLYSTGFLALVIIYEIRKVFNTLNRQNPFMMDNVKSLKRIAQASFIISFLYIFKIIFFNTILTIIIVMIFIIAGLFAIIFAEVFRQAVIVKEENDFTI